VISALRSLTTEPSTVVLLTITLLSALLNPVLDHSIGWYTFGSLMLRITLEVFLKYSNYVDMKSLEYKWNKQYISKLSKSKRGKSWVEASVSELSIGDLVLLKPNTISPADMLILYTSDKLRSEVIVSVNERKITGMNKVSIKSAICSTPEILSKTIG
jgi:magnesium-transporting ATPase (P-type)